MTDKTLTNVAFFQGVPVSGRCSKCGRPFNTPTDAMPNPEKATHDFYAAFESHKCDKDVSQAAARIVREATEQ
jgi:hypothetical protein